MERISSAALQAKIMTTAYITGLIDDLRHNDKGQASTEYAGILFVIVAIIAALIGLGFTEVGQAIKDKMTEAMATSAGGAREARHEDHAIGRSGGPRDRGPTAPSAFGGGPRDRGAGPATVTGCGQVASAALIPDRRRVGAATIMLVIAR